MTWQGWAWVGIGMCAVGAACIAVYGVITMIRHSDQGSLPGIKQWQPKALPILLMVDQDFEHAVPGLNAAVEYAAEWWNITTGAHLFDAHNGSLRGETVMIMSHHNTVSSRRDRSHVASFTRVGTDSDGNIVRASIYIIEDAAKTLDSLVLRRVVTHELGHVLGLAHDENQQSVMYPTALHHEFSLLGKDRDRIRQQLSL